MKYFNKLILCAAVAAAFGANAATYNKEGETTQTIVITKSVQLQATPGYRVTDNKAGGGTIVRTSDGSTADLYIGVGASSHSNNDLRIVDNTGTLTLTAALGCGNGGSPGLDTTANLSGNNSAAATCTTASSISTIVSGMSPKHPDAGSYTFTQEYGTFVE
ncbi:TPA: hypothetical protein JS174_003541 [Escherichia coli]|nr:hypothetical protein [Escherichia coli]MED0128171.1 hypothetical protein [Escherichia coli]MED0161226.1 hypothetical protein [Escherichia coli]MED0284464.1 hypothetical protein [Escherichia coli]HAX9772245.1 hypothetical protein [Escherichia coli]